jgi:hypothetical protein
MKNLNDIKIIFDKKFYLNEKNLINYLKSNFFKKKFNFTQNLIGNGSIHTYIYTSFNFF